MRRPRPVTSIVLALAALAIMAMTAGATTLVRQGLEDLAAQNEAIVQGTVVDIHSYWNADHNFIYTDVRIQPSQVLKGTQTPGDLTITLMGGTVGETTILVVAGPELVPGTDYLMFLNHEGLPGGVQRLTVRDLMQGVFEVSNGRVFSQAISHPLLPDARGLGEPPGGVEGMKLDDMIQQLRNLVRQR